MGMFIGIFMTIVDFIKGNRKGNEKKENECDEYYRIAARYAEYLDYDDSEESA